MLGVLKFSPIHFLVHPTAKIAVVNRELILPPLVKFKNSLSPRCVWQAPRGAFNLSRSR